MLFTDVHFYVMQDYRDFIVSESKKQQDVIIEGCKFRIFRYKLGEHKF